MDPAHGLYTVGSLDVRLESDVEEVEEAKQEKEDEKVNKKRRKKNQKKKKKKKEKNWLTPSLKHTDSNTPPKHNLANAP